MNKSTDQGSCSSLLTYLAFDAAYLPGEVVPVPATNLPVPASTHLEIAARMSSLQDVRKYPLPPWLLDKVQLKLGVHVANICNFCANLFASTLLSQ